VPTRRYRPGTLGEAGGTASKCILVGFLLEPFEREWEETGALGEQAGKIATAANRHAGFPDAIARSTLR
jgi:hypothetical protein